MAVKTATRNFSKQKILSVFFMNVILISVVDDREMGGKKLLLTENFHVNIESGMFVESEEMKLAVGFRIRETLTDLVRNFTWKLRRFAELLGRVLCKEFSNKLWRHISETWYLTCSQITLELRDASVCTSIWWANLPTLFARGSYNDNDSLESDAIRKSSLSRKRVKQLFRVNRKH